ncbi:MAG TPA: hypothetical protein VIF15_01760 [Polyangiaceae bacterium]|jgi:uncharacterized protein YfkK (UPF0435 family)
MPPSRPRYVTAVMGRVFAVRWRHFDPPDLARVRAEIADVRRILGRPLTYLSLVPASARTFSPGELEALADYLRDLLAHDCERIHHVIAGQGFAASARRSIVTNLALALVNPGVFHTHATLEEALTSIAGMIGVKEDQLLRDARAKGLAFPHRA